MASDSSSKRLPWRKHYCGDFLGRAGRWPYEAIGCYMVLLDLIYLNGPMSDTELEANLLPLSEGSRSLIRSVLQRTDAGWTHHRVEEDRLAALDRSSKARSSSYARWHQEEADAVAMRTHSERSADAVQMECGTVHASVSASENVSVSQKGDARGKIIWQSADGFAGITERDRAEWAEAYPAVNLDRQLAAMHQWLLANPTKARKSNWRRFVTGWFSRKQDRGGDAVAPQVSSRIETSDERRARKDAEFKKNLDIAMARIGVAGNPPPRASLGLNGVAVHPSQGTQQKAS